MGPVAFATFVWALLAALAVVFAYELAITLRVWLRGRRTQ